FVSPDPASRTDYEQRYQRVFSREPTRLSSLAYDAVALAALLSREQGAAGVNSTALQNNEGFLGSDGIFRFRAAGSTEPGLAIMQVQAGAATPLDPAPRRFAGPPS